MGTLTDDIMRRDIARGSRPCCFCRTPFTPSEASYHSYCSNCESIMRVEAARAEYDAVADRVRGWPSDLVAKLVAELKC